MSISPDAHIPGYPVPNPCPDRPFVPFRPEKPYTPLKPDKQKQGSAMTIAAGFRCKDGVVLCADTEISVGETGKYQESKILRLIPDCFVAYAGDADFVKEIVPRLRQAAMAGRPETTSIPENIGQEWKKCFREFYAKAPRLERSWADLLIAVRLRQRSALYSASGPHFVEVESYRLFGIGADVARAAFHPLYRQDMTVRQAAMMTVYGLQQTKEFVQKVGKTSEVLLLEDRRDILDLYPSMLTHSETEEAEKDFFIFQEAMRPLLVALPDLAVEEDAFRRLIKMFGKRLMARRETRLHAKKKERKAWEKEQERLLRELEEAL